MPGETINPVAEPAAEVSNVKIEEQSLSFDVDQTGVPVLVKVSYFPNWQVSGAEGPYRIGPNMMVVVPTSNHVELTYGRTPIDYVTMLLSLVGIGLCFVWRRKGDVVHAGELPVASWWRRTPRCSARRRLGSRFVAGDPRCRIGRGRRCRSGRGRRSGRRGSAR